MYCLFLFFLQLLLKAFDSLYPNDFATAIVEIDISRNEYGPVFVDKPYRAVVDEEATIGTHVLTINATDKNINVSNRLL